MLTKAELAAARERAEKATPGPWYAHATDDWMCMNARYVGLKKCDFRHDNERGLDIDDPDDGDEIICVTLLQSPPLVYQDECDENTLFIAHARADVPALLAHIEELEAKLQRALDYARAAADFSVPFRTHGRGRWTDMIELLQEEDEK